VTSQEVLLALSVFAACAVEAVEALTIVVAAGVARGWRSALEGAATALILLAVIVGAVGVPLLKLVPIDGLRVVVGALLLTLGLQWLRKAVLRASGHLAAHDEDAIYARTVASLGGLPGGADVPSERSAAAAPRSGRRDAVAFAVAFKGVMLEGTEVVLIVLSLGTSSHRLGLAAASAAAAAAVVIGVGVVVARQLSEVPENRIKAAVGVLLTSFGVFWLGEGAGVDWPGHDLWILALAGCFSLVSALLVSVLRRPGLSLPSRPPAATPVTGRFQSQA
jgi:uncharacterized membrane protein